MSGPTVRGAALRGAAWRSAGLAAPRLLLAAPGLLLAVAAFAVGCGTSSKATDLRIVSVLVTGTERVTGFAAGDGRVITVAHGLGAGDGARDDVASLRVQAGHETPRPARLLRLDLRADLAVLAVRGLGGEPPELAAARGGDPVRLGLLRDGVTVSAAATVRRAVQAHVRSSGAERALSRPALELEAGLRPGDSGAPVVSEDGELTGVVFARSRDEPHTAYAVDAQAVERLLAPGRGQAPRS